MATLLFQAKPNRRPFRLDNGDVDLLAEQQRSQLSDITKVWPDSTTDFGSRICKREWIASGRDAADWPGGWLIIHIPDLPYEKAIKVTARLMFLAHPWRVLIENIPTAKLKKLKADGEITLSLAAIKDHIVHKLDARTLDQA